MRQKKKVWFTLYNDLKMQVLIFDLPVTESQLKSLKLTLTTLTFIMKIKTSVSIA